MNAADLNKAIELAQTVGHSLVATADAQGLPHVAVAGELGLAKEGRIAVSAWFCPGTVTNLTQNRHIALVIWDRAADKGYQLLGEVESVTDIAMMDGYQAGLDEKPTPQVEKQLLISVEKIILFSQAPHSDLETQGQDGSS